MKSTISAKIKDVKLKTILSVFSFKHNRFPDGILMKHKARISSHGGMQQWGVKYWETCAPVVDWISVRSILSITSINEFPIRSIDFVPVFLQYYLDVDLFMELTLVMAVGVNIVEGVPKLNKSLYGIKKASESWFGLLKNCLESRCCHQSQGDTFLFYIKYSFLLTCVDDCVIVSHKQETITSLIESLNNVSENNMLTYEGDISNYFGVNIKKIHMGKYNY